MLTQCPHCRQSLPLTEEQRARLHQALEKLEAGKALTIKCPSCHEAIALNKSGESLKSARSAATAAGRVKPPPPPSLDWLQSVHIKEEEKIEDVPLALVVHKADEHRSRVIEALESVGYQCVTAESAAEAVERMRFINFSCTVFRTGTDGPFEQSKFHTYMRHLTMDRRRYIFYILIGEQFHTLYNLEALSHSANLVINSADQPHLTLILRKSIPTYEELFGPLLEEFNISGRR